MFASSAAYAAEIDVFAWPNSVMPGHAVQLYISSQHPFVDVTVYRDAKPEVRVWSHTYVSVHEQAAGYNAYENGCNWLPRVQVPVGSNWPSGMYFVKVRAPTGAVGYALFIVRAWPEFRSKILVALAEPTWQAYNAWGGKSLYGYNSTDGIESKRVSRRRPYLAAQGFGLYPRWERFMIHWLQREGYAFDVCSGLDLAADPRALERYTLLVLAGHDEYWTREQRQAIEAFVDGGGNLASFSGNTAWWQIRTGPAREHIECYRTAATDPLAQTDPGRTTVNWFAPPVNWPINNLLGADWRNGGYVDFAGHFPASAGYGGYTVMRPEHWVFEGTGLTSNAVFGQQATIVGIETDGALLVPGVSPPVTSGADGCPRAFQVLATSPASTGTATMGIIERENSTIFNAATTDWCHGLGVDATVERITRNVLNRLSLGVTSAAPGSRAPATFTLASANPTRSESIVSYELQAPAYATLSVYDVQGRLVRHGPAAPVSEGQHFWVWDLRDDRGARVPPGVYYQRLRSGDFTATLEAVVLR
jgi:hypothetical protein